MSIFAVAMVVVNRNMERIAAKNVAANSLGARNVAAAAAAAIVSIAGVIIVLNANVADRAHACARFIEIKPKSIVTTGRVIESYAKVAPGTSKIRSTLSQILKRQRDKFFR